MTSITLERINALNRERLELFRQVANGHRGDPVRLRRIAEIKSELEALWDERRREQPHAPGGIDRVIDAAYQRVYGPGYREAVTPTLVADSGERQRRAA